MTINFLDLGTHLPTSVPIFCPNTLLGRPSNSFLIYRIAGNFGKGLRKSPNLRSANNSYACIHMMHSIQINKFNNIWGRISHYTVPDVIITHTQFNTTVYVFIKFFR